MRNPNGQLEIRVPGSTPLRSGVEEGQTAAYGPSEQKQASRSDSPSLSPFLSFLGIITLLITCHFLGSTVCQALYIHASLWMAPLLTSWVTSLFPKLSVSLLLYQKRAMVSCVVEFLKR